MLTTSETATDAQLAFLRSHGIDPQVPLSRLEALSLIQKCANREPIRVQLAHRVRSFSLDPPAGPDLQLARQQRAEFWIDTITGTACVGGEDEVHDLYRRHGCLFCPPVGEQVNGVLDALDQAAPDWEVAHPELFFETLGLNFPELRRH